MPSQTRRFRIILHPHAEADGFAVAEAVVNAAQVRPESAIAQANEPGLILALPTHEVCVKGPGMIFKGHPEEPSDRDS